MTIDGVDILSVRYLGMLKCSIEVWKCGGRSFPAVNCASGLPLDTSQQTLALFTFRSRAVEFQHHITSSSENVRSRLDVRTMAQPLMVLSPSGQNVRSSPTVAQIDTVKNMTMNDPYSKNLPPTSLFAEDAATPSFSNQRSPRKHHSSRKLASNVILSAESTSVGDEPFEEIVQDLQETEIDSMSEAGHETTPLAESAKSYNGTDDSTFSVIPLLPSHGRSPTKTTAERPDKTSKCSDFEHAPHRDRPTTPGTSRRRGPHYDPSSSPTPRRDRPTDHSDTTNLLLEFTGPLPSYSPSSHLPPTLDVSRPSLTQSYTQPDLTSKAANRPLRSPTRKDFQTPPFSVARHLTNLLDFDLPPAPTPRSVPTITPRELEDLKSSYLSQISSLRATLSGKEAEITSLKDAKDDAERRAGHALDEALQHQNAKETLVEEKKEWEARNNDMQTILREIRAEVVSNEKEREELAAKTRNLEKRCEEANLRAAAAESKIAGFETMSSRGLAAPESTDAQDVNTPGSGATKAVEVAVERVARELHVLYKAKHESKVSALKRSYEARWEKRISELQIQVGNLSKENEALRLACDATVSDGGTSMPKSEESEEKKRNFLDQAEKLQTLESDMAALALGMDAVKSQNAILRSDLEISRQENSELVSAVSEMLLLESSMPSTVTAQSCPAASNNDDFRGSHFRPPVTRAPTSSARNGAVFGDSKIGMIKPRSASGNVGPPGFKSGLMSNIERMGRGRAIG